MTVGDYASLFHKAAQDYGIDPALLMAVAQTESNGDPEAISQAGAQGIMQIMPATAKSLGIDARDPTQAIPAAAHILKQNLTKYNGNVEDALRAYNAGPNEAHWQNPETSAYPTKVLNNYHEYAMTQNDNTEKNLSASGQSDDSDDPFVAARKELGAEAAQKQQVQGATDSDDPFVAARKELDEEAKQKQLQIADKSKKDISVPEDLLETAPSSLIKGVGAVTQLPAYGINALTNSLGEAAYGVRRLMGYPADEDMYKKLTNINPIYTGNTIADPLIQAGQAVFQQTPQQNPLSRNLVHDPQTAPGRYENALIQAAVSGKAGGMSDINLPALSTKAIVGGALGSQTASEAAPNSPTAQLLGGVLGGGAPSAWDAAKLRASPEDLASRTLENITSDKNALTKDSEEIIPGSTPTLAQLSNDPNVALLERQLQAKNPAAFAAHEEANESARQNYFEDASGTPEDIATLYDQRDTRTSPLYEQAKKQPLDTKAIDPVLARIDAAVEEVGEGSDAGKTLLGIKDKIQNALPKVDDATGEVTKNKTQSPIVQIYRETRDALNKKAEQDGAYAASVKSVIRPINQALGEAIESQSPSFAQAQKIYRDMSPQIEAAEWLQNLKLKDAAGNFTLAKVNNALTNAERLRASNGINAAKSLSEEQVRTLRNLRDDLLRRERVARASMPRGSNTAQNLLANADQQSVLGTVNRLTGGNLPELVGSGVGSGIGSLVGWPGAGAFAGDITARIAKGLSTRRAGAATNALQNFLINPENYKTYLANQANNTFSTRLLNNLLAGHQ